MFCSEIVDLGESNPKPLKKKSREFSYTSFMGTGSIKIRNNATLWKHKVAHGNFVETQSCTLQLCANTNFFIFRSKQVCGNTKLAMATLCFHKVGFSNDHQVSFIMLTTGLVFLN